MNRKWIIILILVFTIYCFLRPKEPRTLFTKVVKRITIGGIYDVHPSVYQQKLNENVFSIVQPISSYYGSIEYEADLIILQELSSWVGAGRLATDCYTLSTNNTQQMTQDDYMKVVYNLFGKLIPIITMSAKKKRWCDGAAGLMMLYHMIIRINGFVDSNYVIAKYNRKGQVDTIQYASNNITGSTGSVSLLTPSTFFSLLPGVVSGSMTPSQIIEYGSTFPSVYQNMIESVLSGLQSFISQKTQIDLYATELSVDVFSQLMVMTVWIPLQNPYPLLCL